MTGKFITFEGGEGCGKSTQVRFLKSWLESFGIDVVLTREPGGSPGAEEIRKLLVEGSPDRWAPKAEMLLFMAARADHNQQTILPSLNADKWVVSDRYMDSTLVYQGVARGMGLYRVIELHNSLFDLSPDLTIMLDVDPEIGLARSMKRQNSETRFEQFDLEFHRGLQVGYRAVAAIYNSRCEMISVGGKSADQVFIEIKDVLYRRYQFGSPK